MSSLPSDADDVLESIAQLPLYFRTALSPDGNRLAYHYDVTGRHELYIHDLVTGERHQITDGELQRTPSGPIRWGATGNQVYVHRNAPADDIYQIRLDDHCIEPVITGDEQYKLWDVGPDGRSLLYSRSGEGHDRRLYHYDRTRGAHRQITESDEFVFARGNEFDPCGDQIVFAASASVGESDISECSVYVAAADGSNREKLSVGSDGIRTFGKAWSPQGRRLLIYEPYGQGRSGVYDRSTGDTEWYGDDNQNEKPVTFLPDGTRFLAIQKDRVDTIPVVYTLDGQRRELDFDGVATLDPTSSWDIVLGEDEVLLSQSTTTEQGRLLRYDVASDHGHPVARVDYGDLDPASFVAAEYLTYDSVDGLEIGGLLYEPEVSEGHHPAVVMVHGGRHGRATRAFDWRAQILVRLGYAVFKPNYRGSSGRGTDFKRRTYADIGGGESKDIAAAGRWLANRRQVNPDRIGIFGHSHGGYLTALQMVTNPTLWAGGVASSGMMDLVEVYEDHPDLPGLHEMGDPEDDPALLRERSPISHADALERPLLILHGVDDPSCPVEQAREFRAELLAAGYTQGEDFQYHEFDHRHGTLDADRKVRRWQVVLSFVDQHV